MERIEAAAVIVSGEVWALPRPARHCHLIRAVAGAGAAERVTQAMQGFVTSEGRFVDRAEAARIALAAGQIHEAKDTLFTEDLW